MALATESFHLKRGCSRYYAAGPEFCSFCPQVVYVYRNIDSPRFVIALLKRGTRLTVAIRAQRFRFEHQSLAIRDVRSKTTRFLPPRKKEGKYTSKTLIQIRRLVFCRKREEKQKGKTDDKKISKLNRNGFLKILIRNITIIGSK